MSRSQRRWYVLALVLLVVAVGAFGIALKSNATINGSPETALTGTGSTAAGSSTPNVITTPSGSGSGSGQPSGSGDPTGSGGPTSTFPEPPSVGDPDGAVGAESAGDPYYPDAGNGGYDVAAYRVDLTFDPESGELEADTTITATVTGDQRLGRFSFDLQPTMQVSAVTVDGVAAGFGQHDAKLVVTPRTGVEPTVSMTVVVTYAGEPGPITEGTAGLSDGGWYTTESGGAVVIGEPFSASAWYPVNEHPTDRATFAVTAQVPTGWKVISNGLPVGDDLPTPAAGYDVFGWAETSEMASYLSTLYVDTFTLTSDTSASGLPVINAYGPGTESLTELGDRTPEFVDFLASRFGPYPFDATGGIYLADPFGFALETQTRPVYSAGYGTVSTVIHELAHQWFGDDVTVNRWADICLNECFASYASWLWDEHTGRDLDAIYRAQITLYQNQRAFWDTPLYDPGAGNEFGVVYSRGPLALHALRAEMGDDKFNELLLSWIEVHAGKSASWSEFEELVSTIAGKDESAFMNAWFRGTTVPAAEFLWPGDLHE